MNHVATTRYRWKILKRINSYSKSLKLIPLITLENFLYLLFPMETRRFFEAAVPKSIVSWKAWKSLRNPLDLRHLPPISLLRKKIRNRAEWEEVDKTASAQVYQQTTPISISRVSEPWGVGRSSRCFFSSVAVRSRLEVATTPASWTSNRCVEMSAKWRSRIYSARGARPKNNKSPKSAWRMLPVCHLVSNSEITKECMWIVILKFSRWVDEKLYLVVNYLFKAVVDFERWNNINWLQEFFKISKSNVIGKLKSTVFNNSRMLIQKICKIIFKNLLNRRSRLHPLLNS